MDNNTIFLLKPLMFASARFNFFESYHEVSHIGDLPCKKAKMQTFLTSQMVDFESNYSIVGFKKNGFLKQGVTLRGAVGKYMFTLFAPSEITIKTNKAGYTMCENDGIIEEVKSFLIFMDKE